MVYKKLFGPIYKFDLNYLVNCLFSNIQKYYDHAISTKNPRNLPSAYLWIINCIPASPISIWFLDKPPNRNDSSRNWSPSKCVSTVFFLYEERKVKKKPPSPSRLYFYNIKCFKFVWILKAKSFFLEVFILCQKAMYHVPKVQ